MNNNRLSARAAAITALCLMLLPLTAPGPQVSLGRSFDQAPPAWRDTGIIIQPDSSFCFDAARAHVVLVKSKSGTVTSYDWNTGQVAPTPGGSTPMCADRNRFFNQDLTQRYKLDNLPDVDEPNPSTRLLYSDNGGATWQERGHQLNGMIDSVLASDLDARAVYAGAYEADNKYSVFFSSDAGVTWEHRSTGALLATYQVRVYGPAVLTPLDGSAAPIDTLLLRLSNAVMGSNRRDYYYLSADGGRTFNEVGYTGLGLYLDLAYVGGRVVRLQGWGSGGGTYSLSASTDGGKDWQPVDLPQPGDGSFVGLVRPGVSSGAPSTLFLFSWPQSYYSLHAGQAWHSFDDLSDVQVSPYAPLTLLGARAGGSNLFVMDLPDGNKSLTFPAAPNKVPGGSYFPETGHNLWGAFKQYWQAHGGLAQFGYPRTEPFMEVNQADGHIYLTQYFERNRFEYHPENRGTPFEVQLGLLGSQLTAQRRAAHEGPFSPITDPGEAGRTYFALTGHTLRNSFKQYWEAHGGLELHGYPISEEFYEVSEVDGKSYVVQYFERSRLEWHPEYKGTQNEVLLGALGNILLAQKGW